MNRHPLKEWAIAVRPWSFPASAMPVVVTSCYLLWTETEIHVGYCLWALVSILLFHAAGNTWSDYFDYRRGIDCTESSSAKSLVNKIFQPREILILSLFLLTAAALSGIGLLLFTQPSLLWIGLGGICCTLAYPFFKYHAAGDFVIFVAYALLPALGTSLIATGAFHYSVLWTIALPVGLITVAILHINNLRDQDNDRQAQISTLPIRLGTRLSAIIYRVELILPLLWIVLCVAVGQLPPASLSVLLVIPATWGNLRTLQRYLQGDSTCILHLDERTAQLQLLFSGILSIAFVLTHLLT
ncbi:MAG: prenyltransferase [Bacteroidaceae bacterium]